MRIRKRLTWRPCFTALAAANARCLALVPYNPLRTLPRSRGRHCRRSAPGAAARHAGSQVAFIWNPEHTDNEILEAARALGIKLHVTAIGLLASAAFDTMQMSTSPRRSPSFTPRPARGLLVRWSAPLAIALDLGLDDAQADPNALTDHRAFKLGKTPVIWNSSLPAGSAVLLKAEPSWRLGGSGRRPRA